MFVICRCEEGLLDNMVLGQNIAKNAALRENVFMMAICIELRIPLFLVGKPGSSKSLAKSIIQDSMHGPGSRSLVLREFKQVSKLVCFVWVQNSAAAGSHPGSVVRYSLPRIVKLCVQSLGYYSFSSPSPLAFGHSVGRHPTMSSGLLGGGL